MGYFNVNTLRVPSIFIPPWAGGSAAIVVGVVNLGGRPLGSTPRSPRHAWWQHTFVQRHLLGIQCLYLAILSRSMPQLFLPLFFDATDFIFFDASRNVSFWRRCCCGVLLQLSPPSTLPQSQAAAMLLLLLPCASALLPLPLISSLLLLSFDTDFHIPS